MQLGQYLVSQNILTEAQLQRGLSRHYKTHDKLGECLILEGFITDTDLLKALSQLMNYPFDLCIEGVVTESTKKILNRHLSVRLCAIATEVRLDDDSCKYLIYFNDNLSELKSHIETLGIDVDYVLARKSVIRTAIHSM